MRTKAGRGGHRDRRPERDVPVAAMPELVRDNGQHLGRRRRLDEGVVEDDPPRCAEPRDVRVQLRRPLARVGDEHLADGDTAFRGEVHDRAAQLLVLERTEPVEDRLEHDRRHEAEQEHEHGRPRRGDDRPPGRKDDGGADESGEADPREHRPDRDRLDAVDGELLPGLAREPERPLVRQPEPDGEGQAHERRQDDEEAAEHERAECLGQRIDDSGGRLPGRRERDEDEQSQPEREVGEDRAVARIVISACEFGLDHGGAL